MRRKLVHLLLSLSICACALRAHEGDPENNSTPLTLSVRIKNLDRCFTKETRSSVYRLHLLLDLKNKNQDRVFLDEAIEISRAEIALRKGDFDQRHFLIEVDREGLVDSNDSKEDGGLSPANDNTQRRESPTSFRSTETLTLQGGQRRTISKDLQITFSTKDLQSLSGKDLLIRVFVGAKYKRGPKTPAFGSSRVDSEFQNNLVLVANPVKFSVNSNDKVRPCH